MSAMSIVQQSAALLFRVYAGVVPTTNKTPAYSGALNKLRFYNLWLDFPSWWPERIQGCLSSNMECEGGQVIIRGANQVFKLNLTICEPLQYKGHVIDCRIPGVTTECSSWSTEHLNMGKEILPRQQNLLGTPSLRSVWWEILVQGSHCIKSSPCRIHPLRLAEILLARGRASAVHAYVPGIVGQNSQFF